MKAIEWSDALSVGVGVIDGEHKRLIKIANAIVKISNETREPKKLINALHYLREYTVVHFQNEESFMQTIHYPGLFEHKKEHIRLKQSVKDYQAELFHAETLDGIDVLSFIRAWLLDHVLKTDMKIKEFLEQKEDAQSSTHPE